MQPAFATFVTDYGESVKYDVGAKFTYKETDRIRVDIMRHEVHQKGPDDEIIEHFGWRKLDQ